MSKKILIIFAFIIAGFMVACNTDKPGKEELNPEVVSVTIGAFEEFWPIENTDLSLTANVNVKDGASNAVSWTSSNTDVASIDNNGKVTPLQEGKVTFTATSVFDGTKTATGDITFYSKRTPINGGFELELPVWGVYSNSDNSIAAIDNEVVYSGQKSFKVQNAGNYTVIWHGVDLGVENNLSVGDYVKASCYVYSPVANEGIKPVLMIEALDSNNTKTIIVQTPTNVLDVANEWVKLETAAAKLPVGTVSFNVKVEFHESGLMYVDSVNTVSTKSNDVTLKSLSVDGKILENYSNTINQYKYVLSDVQYLPIVTAEVNEATTTVDFVQATAETLKAKITVTAEDDTKREIIVEFVVGNMNDLVDITVNDVKLGNFSVDRYDYYVLLEKGNKQMPTISFTKAVEFANSRVVMPESLPGVAQIIMENTTTTIYEIYIDIVADNRLIMGYPDMDFERTQEEGLARNWGFDRCEVTNQKSHSGNNALVAQTQGGGGWVGMDLAGGDYPQRGDRLIAGVWFFVEKGENVSGDITVEIYGKESQGQITNLVYTTKAEDYGKWVYIETEISTAVAEEAQYIQIVVKNWTNQLCYFDDITLKKVN